MERIEYVCTGCGNAASVDLTRPSIDDRYAVGYCIRCTPTPSPQKLSEGANRETIFLIRRDLFDPEEFADLQKTRAAKKLIKSLPRTKKKFSEKELEGIQEAYKWLNR